MNATSPHMDRLLDLSVDDALNALSREDAEEYARLRASYPEFDPEPTDRAVGIALAAMLGAGEAPPDSLQSRLQADLEAHFRPRASAPATLTVAPPRARPHRLPLWSGWVAAAASLLLAVGLWMQSSHQTSLPSPAQARRALIESGRAVVVLNWSAGGDRTGAQTQGDIVWDPQRQVGYMRFVGLARNDPAREQYQLWIFDAERDERYPVDGGVFDIGADGEVVIPIRARLRVGDAKLFAITVEKPGGVVVSDRSRIAVLAKPG